MRLSPSPDNKYILVRFAYSPRLVELVRTLPGRKWNAKDKVWSIPMANCQDSVKQLKSAGFECDPAITESLRDTERREMEAISIAGRDDIEFKTNLPLFPFQRVVSAFMVNAGSCLNACGVRTGKTIMSLAAVNNTGSRKNLVIVPGSVIYQWKSECNLWLPEYKVFVAVGNPKEREAVYKQVADCVDPFFLIMTYDVARIDKQFILLL
jgi:SNF2 family DNA or RNA helicase